MKTAISIPDELFDAADEIAQRFGMSRSEVYARAVADFVRKHRKDRVTEMLDEIYSQEESSVDPVLDAMQMKSMPREEW